MENAQKVGYARKLSFFIMRLSYVQILGGQNRYELLWAVMIAPPALPINDQARNDAHTQGPDKGGNGPWGHFWWKGGIANGLSRMNLKLDLDFG